MSTLLLSFIAFCSTCAGGIVALRQRERFHLVVAFAAGTLIGLAAFEWLPQLFQSLATLPTERFAAFVALAVGFFTFHILDRVASSWQSWNRQGTSAQSVIGVISVLLFSLHRLVEGATIGISFQMNLAIGLVIAGALILHNLIEGLNAVTILLSSRSTHRQALVWLLLFACTPVLGVWVTAWLPMPATLVPRYLGFFAGFLLYMGAGHLLPEIQREGGLLPLLCTLAGALFALTMTWLLLLV
jgi:zinc transporter ZupT